jgi:ribosome-binding factor A
VATPRTARVGQQIRNEIAELLTFSVRDPAIGFITITRVTVTPDLQQARVYYTTMGDEKARRETRRGLERATPMMRRHLGKRMRLRRVPELQFFFDESIERQDRIEQILQELHAERAERETSAGAADVPATDGTTSDEPDGDN